MLRGGSAISMFLRHLFLVLFIFVILLPFINMFSTAISDEKDLYLNPGRTVWIPKPMKLDNFIRAITFPNMHFARATMNTLIIIAIDIAATVIVSCWVAYGFARVRFRGRRIMFLLMLSTMMIPTQVRQIPLYIFFTKLGWLNTFIPIVIFSFFGSPFYIFLLRQFIKGIPNDLFDAAKICGCSNYRIFYQITMPQLTPVITTIAVYTFIAQWKALFAPVIYLRDEKLFTIALELSKFQSMVSLPHLAAVPLNNLLMAASILTIIPPAVIFISGQRYFLKNLDISSGLKG